ncbi:DUF3823 domain-containing protein [Sphingobacterium arenae]|uniref:DUF3823 domain-containing protein n=1 Tax=Sphingobacterium arenae TaxID=1280598 RepID=A0ABR7XZG2_9SPHI|nr:DUF3823 domain-containing protein [Sphingobacterium arenae]MBD1424423.1 DUF3823 domain-containing protein [Sphingobacterium arenae]
MKKIIQSGLLCLVWLISSCSLFETDNFEAPDVTLEGQVVDVLTGKPVFTDQGSEGIRVRLTELSWGDNVEHNPDFYCMPDGTFRNTKLFKGNYHITVDGPFIPLLRRDPNGKELADESLIMDLESSHQVKFEVQPFLHVEWVGEPTVDDGKVTAQVKVSRAVSPEDFRTKVEPMGGYSDDFLNVTDIQFFVSYSSSVGYRARDERWSSRLDYAGNSFDNLFGEAITLESNGTIPTGRTVFVRAAARINYDTPTGSGTKRWNYSEAKEVLIN